MALTERFENDKIEVVGQYKAIQVRRATVIERDGVEINRSFHRHVLQPGTVGVGTDQLTDTDISGEDADVQTSVLLPGLMQSKKHGVLNL